MNRHFRISAACAVVLTALTVVASASASADPATPRSTVVLADLRCEYLKDPLGVDVTHPRLFWKLETATPGQRQTAYQVLVASSPDKLARNEGDRWDSGRVASDQSAFVTWAGALLESRAACWWKVRIWDKDGLLSAWSAPAFWSMGVLKDSDWRGSWIASDLELMEYQRTLRAMTDFGMEPETEIWEVAKKCVEMTRNVTEAPAVYLRKEFRADRPVRRATASICGLGMYELSLNGRRVGDRRLDPAYTDYDKRALYSTLDVTDALTSGTNAVGVVLGNGWFNLIIPHSLRFYAADYIAPPRLRLDIDIEYDDGSRETVASAPDWKCTTEGPLRFNCVLGGETYDARREMPGWDKPGFDDSSWKAARPAEAPKGRLVSSLFPPVRRLARVAATTVTRHGDGWRFDLGEETAGWGRLKLRGRPGQEIVITYPGSGSHTLGRYQTCRYVCSGRGEEVFESRFSYNGFQYIDVSGLDYEPALADAEGQVMGTDMERAGSFSCSDERLNKIQEVLLRTLRNYVMHIPCDPTREKAGWTQDVETDFFEFAYNLKSAPTFIKWQRDFLDAVQANGYVPPVVPGRFDGPTINGPWWGGAVVYAPWYIYQFHGDRGILEESYPLMQRYVRYLDGIAKDGVVEWGLGDWMEVGSVRPVRTPVSLTSTAAWFWFTDILRQSAELLGKPEDAARYAGQAARIRESYNKAFLNPESGVYSKGSQTGQLLSLVLGLAPDDKRPLILQRLADQITSDSGHLSTGFVGTPHLLTGLAELGRPELAWTIATQTDYPGFIDAIINRGNTVMKEDWNGGLVQMPSLQGPVGTWFYHTLAGIRPDPSGPGFRKIVLKPETTGTLAWVKARHETHYGPVVSEWEREGDRFAWRVVVPPNAAALIHVPAARSAEILVDGLPASSSPGLAPQGWKEGFAVFAAQSGPYRFESRPAAAPAGK